MKIFKTLSEIPTCIGQEVSVSEWEDITQPQVNTFAESTKDLQWIHVDVERAKDGPFGGPIAHGFLTLSLLPRFFATAITIEGTRMGVNYGLNKVRFTAPVPVGSRIRARLKLLEALPLEGNGLQMTWLFTIESEGSDKPVCIAELLMRRYV